MIELLCTDYNKKATFIHYNLNSAVLDKCHALEWMKSRFNAYRQENGELLIQYPALQGMVCWNPIQAVIPVSMNMMAHPAKLTVQL